MRALFLLFIPCVLSAGCIPAARSNDAHDAVRMTFQASLPSAVSRSELRRSACGLAPIVPVEGERRAVEIWVDARPCDAAIPESALRLDVSHPRNVDRILLEMSVPSGAGPEGAADVERGLGEIRTELENRTRSRREQTSSRPSQKMLGVSIVLGSIALLAGATGAIIVGVGLGARSGGDAGILAGGGAVLGFGAGPTFLGGMITLIAASSTAQSGN